MKKKRRLIVLSKCWGYVLATASLVCITLTTIYPFNFVVSSDVSISLQTIFQQFERSSNLKDYANNIILFIPWGFGLAWILPRKKTTYISTLILAVVTSFGISLTVEILQYFLPERVSNFTDVATNTIGGGIGAFIYRYRLQISNFFRTLISSNYHRLSPKSVGLVFIGYFVFIYLVVFSLLFNVNLSNWDRDFPLIIGNETTGDRPWSGKINQFHISNRALSGTEIDTAFEARELFWLKPGNSVVSYLFSDEIEDINSNFTNILADQPLLVWQQPFRSQDARDSSNQNKLKSITLGQNRWLKTSESVSKITQKIQQTNQFTISAIVATQKIQQPDYPRIISISKNPYYRNITIAQNREDLILRFRTPVTGVNGNEPELLIPNIFNDLDFHHLIITFDADTLDLYIDNQKNQYTFAFEPEITLWSYFPLIVPGWQINLNYLDKLFYRLGFYVILFVPLGFLGGLLSSLLYLQKTKQFLLINLVCLIPAFLIEYLYKILSSQPMRIPNLLFNIVILLLTIVVTQRLVKKQIHNKYLVHK